MFAVDRFKSESNWLWKIAEIVSKLGANQRHNTIGIGYDRVNSAHVKLNQKCK